MTEKHPQDMTDKELLAQVRERYDRLWRGDDVLELADRYERMTIRKKRTKKSELQDDVAKHSP